MDVFRDQNIAKHYNWYLKEDLKFKFIIVEWNSTIHSWHYLDREYYISMYSLGNVLDSWSLCDISRILYTALQARSVQRTAQQLLPSQHLHYLFRCDLGLLIHDILHLFFWQIQNLFILESSWSIFDKPGNYYFLEIGSIIFRWEQPALKTGLQQQNIMR